MPLCLIGGGKVVAMAVTGFTLAWMHTVEHIPWEEDWRVAGDHLVLERSRVKGSGAGMDPAPNAHLVDGWFEWKVDETRKQVELARAHEPQAGDWQFCPRTPDGERGPCRPMGDILDADTVTLRPCAGETPGGNG